MSSHGSTGITTEVVSRQAGSQVVVSTHKGPVRKGRPFVRLLAGVRGQGTGVRRESGEQEIVCEGALQKPSTYRDLVTWQKAVDLVDVIYDASTGWPPSELFALTSQIRRAAVSISANLAEGYGRFGPREYAHHISIAHGSLLEVETLVTIARRRNFIDRNTELRILDCTSEVGKLLNGLHRSLQR